MTTVRVAAHVHSSWSYDAEWSLEEIARSFRRRRYDVVLMSEHDRGFNQERWIKYQKACAAESTGDILLIPGIEYEDADNVVHTPVWGRTSPSLAQGDRPLSCSAWLGRRARLPCSLTHGDGMPFCATSPSGLRCFAQ